MPAPTSSRDRGRDNGQRQAANAQNSRGRPG
jgi:hypothetical protein